MTEKDIRKLEYSEFAALSAELIENSGGLRFRAQGRSMLPTIHSGDTLTLEKTEADKLMIGDIVLIQNASNSLLAHRIIQKNHYVETPHLDPPATLCAALRAGPLPQGERKEIQNEDTWTTCGDALQMHDEPFKANQLIGIVRSIEHNGSTKPLSPIKGRLLAAVSRHSTTIIGRIIKRLMRTLG